MPVVGLMSFVLPAVAGKTAEEVQQMADDINGVKDTAFKGIVAFTMNRHDKMLQLDKNGVEREVKLEESKVKEYVNRCVAALASHGRGHSSTTAAAAAAAAD